MKLTLEQQRINRKLWVEALRSGKYRQGKNVLRTSSDEMCCLGVLADISGCKWARDGQGWRANGEDNSAPFRAMAFVGLAGSEGEIEYGDPLSYLNDNGASFIEIAAIIESEPEGLFAESVAPLLAGWMS